MIFFRKDEQLENIGSNILDTTWAAFPTLARNQIALTWIVYDPPVLVNTGGALTPDAFGTIFTVVLLIVVWREFIQPV